MKKWIVVSLVVLMIIIVPCRFAEAASEGGSSTVTTTQPSLIPDKVDLGKFNSFDPLNYIPWRTLDVSVYNGSSLNTEPIYLDILVENSRQDIQWMGVNTDRLTQEGLTEDQITPLIHHGLTGWSNLLCLNNDMGYAVGSISGTSSWHYQRYIPEKFRLVAYFPNSKKLLYTDIISVNQYNAAVKLDFSNQSAKVLRNTNSVLWKIKLLLRVIVSALFVLLFILPFIDHRRWIIFGVKLFSGFLYMGLVALVPTLFQNQYGWTLFLAQLLLSAGEGYCVFRWGDKKGPSLRFDLWRDFADRFGGAGALVDVLIVKAGKSPPIK